MWKLILVSCLVSASVLFVSGAKLPSFFSKCRKDSPDLNKCIVKSGNEAMKHLAQGNNNIHFPSLRPLKVPFMKVDVGDGLKMNLTNCLISGIDNLNIETVDVNLDTKRFHFQITNPRFEHDGDYDITGRILLLPINGHGPINATFINSKTNFIFEYDLKEIKGKVYMVPKNPIYKSEVERAYYKLGNLFNGNEVLSKEMNNFLEENWKDVNDELGPRLNDVIGQLLTEIVTGLTTRVPFEDLFEKP